MSSSWRSDVDMAVHDALTDPATRTSLERYSHVYRTVYEKTRRAVDDWNSGRACLDNRGTYRIRQHTTSLGGKTVYSKAPWSDAVKNFFDNNDAFHDFCTTQEEKT